MRAPYEIHRSQLETNRSQAAEIERLNGELATVKAEQIAATVADLKRTLEETSRRADAATRPWLVIEETTFDRETGKIWLTIRNVGKTPAIQVEVENRVEISKEMQSRMIPPDELADFEQRWRMHKFFEPEFDSRKQMFGVGPHRGVCVQVGMVLAGHHFKHLIHTERLPELLVKELKISGPRRARFRGQIRYTDAEGKLKPITSFVLRFTCSLKTTRPLERSCRVQTLI